MDCKKYSFIEFHQELIKAGKPNTLGYRYPKSWYGMEECDPALMREAAMSDGIVYFRESHQGEYIAARINDDDTVDVVDMYTAASPCRQARKVLFFRAQPYKSNHVRYNFLVFIVCGNTLLPAHEAQQRKIISVISGELFDCAYSMRAEAYPVVVRTENGVMMLDAKSIKTETLAHLRAHTTDEIAAFVASQLRK